MMIMKMEVGGWEGKGLDWVVVRLSAFHKIETVWLFVLYKYLILTSVCSLACRVLRSPFSCA